MMLVSFVAITIIGMLFLVKSAYGLAGSLNELQNQVKASSNYRDELVGYLVSHNLTKGTQLKSDELANVNVLSLERLEHEVKEHMEDCQSGIHDETLNHFLKTIEDKDGDGRYGDNGEVITDEDRKENTAFIDVMGTC